MLTFQAFLFQSNCRLFVFDTITHSWREKGRGILRLNDMCQSMTEGIFQSRLGELFFNLIKFFIPSRTIRRDWWIIFVDHFCWLSRLLDCFISFISQFFFFTLLPTCNFSSCCTDLYMYFILLKVNSVPVMQYVGQVKKPDKRGKILTKTEIEICFLCWFFLLISSDQEPLHRLFWCQCLSKFTILVMRTQGSLRVVLNTKLWPSMTLEKGNEKSLRITAMDTDKDIKIYLIMVIEFFYVILSKLQIKH